jgi:hypothetical protein
MIKLEFIVADGGTDKKSPGTAGSISHPVTNWQMLGFGRQWLYSRAHCGLGRMLSNPINVFFN